MNILFINPPYKSKIQEFLGAHAPLLGFGSMSHQMEREGHRIDILDCPTLGLNLSDVVKFMGKVDPDVIGITSTTPSFGEACKVVRAIKDLKPECMVVMGGPHVSFEDYSTLKSSYVDVVVRGEGELTMRDLVKCLEKGESLSKVLGITYREKGVIRRNPNRPFIEDLDALFVSYHKLPMSRYRFEGLNYATIVSSRGCPYGCVFCSSSLLHGKKWRCQSAERVGREVRFLIDEYGVKHIEFLDDLFTFNNKRVEEICRIFLKEKLDVQWFCSSRVDTISKELMAKMRKSGCIGIYFGIESGCQRILNLLRKGTRIQQAVKAVRGAKEIGIETVATFILGIPGETVDDIRQTIRFAKLLKPDYAQFTFCTPYPGTELYKFAKANNMLLSEDWSHYTTMEPVLKVSGLSVTELKNLFKEAYLNFVPSSLWKLIKKRKFRLIEKILLETTKMVTSRLS
ncbi:MAG: radical SAM protein [Candidatus Bathyarchaeia archaeon]